MKPKGDEYFYEVQGLLIPKSGGMVNLNQITQNIETFLGIAQSSLDNMAHMLYEGKTRDFPDRMKLMQELLNGMFARKLSADADSILSACKLRHIDIVRKQFSQFRSEVMALLINIERAKIRETKTGANEAACRTVSNKIGDYAEIIANLNAVKYFIDRGKNEEGIGILRDMEDIREHPMSLKVTKALQNEDREEALILLQSMIVDYAQQIIGKQPDDAGQKKKVLAVDDRPEILTTLGSALNEYFQVYGAPSGEKALKIMEKYNMDLFILDIEMPVMDGITLAGKIKAVAKYKNTPVLFLTSNATKEYVVKACEAGAADFIVKPVVKDMVLAKIRQHIG